MSLQLEVHSAAIVQQPDSQLDQEDRKRNTTNLASSANNKSPGIIVVDEDSNFQEGGIRGWATVIGAMLIQFCGFGYVDAFGVFQDYYTRVYLKDDSPSTIAWIGSVNTFIILISGIYVGVLYDRGYFYHLLYLGSFLTSLSLFMLSLIKPDHLYQSFLAQGVGFGIGAGMLFVPSLVVVSHYFEKKRSLAMTFVSAGSPLGSLIHPILLNNLLSHVGYTKATLFSAGLITFMLIIACMLMHPPLPTSTSQPPILNLIRKFYKEWPFIMISAGIFFFLIGYYFPFFYLQLDAAKHGVNERLTFYLLVILNASALVGHLSSGFLANFLGVMHMTVASAIVCSAVIFSMASIGNVTSVVVISVLYGYAVGTMLALEAPLVALFAPDISEVGTRLGVVYIFGALGNLIGPPVQGALLSGGFIWWRPATFSGIFTLIGACCFSSLLFFAKTCHTNSK